MYFGIRDTLYWFILFRDMGIIVILIKGYCIFRNFGICDIENYFGIFKISMSGYGI